MGALLLDEPLGMAHLYGGVLIAAALWLVLKPERRNRLRFLPASLSANLKMPSRAGSRWHWSDRNQLATLRNTNTKPMIISTIPSKLNNASRLPNTR